MKEIKDLTGATVGQYQIAERLGSGGMAVVYRAVQPSLGREVALKILSPALVYQEGFTQRFENEARTLARLDHPHILGVFDFGTVEGITFIVTPLVRGGTLKAMLTGQPLPLAVAWRYLTAIGDGLHHAHEAGVIHRDLKPSNVLLHADGRPLLGDFGLARPSEAPSGITMNGFALGTPGYISPEQAMGAPIDRRTDIYSLGVMAFEMLTGSRPYMADNATDLVRATVYQPVPSACSRNGTLPLQVDSVLSRALAKDPNQRPSTALQFMHELTSALVAQYIANDPQQGGGMMTPPQGTTPVPHQGYLPGVPTSQQNLGGPPSSITPAGPTIAMPYPAQQSPQQTPNTQWPGGQAPGQQQSAAYPVPPGLDTKSPPGFATNSPMTMASAMMMLEHMGVRRLRPATRVLMNSYFMTVLRGAYEVCSDLWVAVLNTGGLQDYAYRHAPNNSEHGIPVEHLTRLVGAFDQVFGLHGREKLRQLGRLVTERDMDRDGSARRQQRRVRLVPASKRLPMVLNQFAFRLDDIRGEHLHAIRAIDSTRYWLVIHDNPFGQGRFVQEKGCDFWVASLETLLRWSGLANDWVVEEVECGCMTGTGDCIFAIRTPDGG
jgi:serine/threonine-protein kinase